MDTRVVARGSLRWPLVAAVAFAFTGCGGGSGTPEAPTTDPGATQDTAAAAPTSPPTEGEDGSSDTGPDPAAPESQDSSEPCELLTAAELEEAVGFTLGAGMHNDLTSAGVDGSACLYPSDPSDTGHVVVGLMTVDQSTLIFEPDLAAGDIQLDGIGDRAHLALGDGWSEVHVLDDDVLVSIEVQHATGTGPADIDERLTTLARTAVDRL